jgi:hypothetical protein
MNLARQISEQRGEGGDGGGEICGWINALRFASSWKKQYTHTRLRRHPEQDYKRTRDTRRDVYFWPLVTAGPKSNPCGAEFVTAGAGAEGGPAYAPGMGTAS